MNINKREENGFTVLQVSGRLDAVTAETFATECKPHLAPDKRIVLDLTTLEYISSAGIRAILLLAKHLKELKGGLAVAGTRGMVKEVFDITGLEKVFPLFETISQAVSGSWTVSPTG